MVSLNCFTLEQLLNCVCTSLLCVSTGELEAADSFATVSSPNSWGITPDGWKSVGWLEVAASWGRSAVNGSGQRLEAAFPELSLWFLCTFRTLTVGAAVSSLTAPNENASGGFSSWAAKSKSVYQQAPARPWLWRQPVCPPSAASLLKCSFLRTENKQPRL